MELNKPISRKQHFLVVAISILIILTVTTCSEEPLQIGIQLLPDDVLLEVHDTTLSVELYTISAWPLSTGSLSYSPLGSVYDPVAGALKAEYLADIFYSELVSFWDTLIEENIEVYNLELQLYYDYLYGDSTAIDFNVYELTVSIPEETSDFVITPDMYDPNPLNLGAPERLNDSTRAFRVMLSNDFAQKFIDPQLVIDSIYNWQSTKYPLFKEHFKGLYLAADFRDSEGGGIIRVDNVSSMMILRTLEWNADSNFYDTVSSVFNIGNPEYVLDSADVVNLGMYQNIPSDDITAVLDDTVNSQPVAYLQSLTGPYVLVDFPGLDGLLESFDDNVVINKAELTFPINRELYDDTYTYQAPANLGLFDNVSKSYLADDGLVSYYFGGFRDTTDFEYMFNVGNHIHYYMRGRSDTLYSSRYILFPSRVPNSLVYPSKTVPSRVVLNGGSSSEPPTLKIIYSLIPE
ncbi:MAG: DUF4270 family protein [Bacteroidales bacterium]|jgi:hypothetical protein